MTKSNRFLGLFLVSSMLVSTAAPANVRMESFEDYQADVTVASQERISEIFDKFQYDMTVEWDQKDPEFRKTVQNEFQTSLDALRTQGVSELEILQYMEQNILDAKTRTDYQALLDSMGRNNVTPKEAARLAQDLLNKNYQQGANWAGGGPRMGGSMLIIGLVIIGVVTYMVTKHSGNHDNDHDYDYDDDWYDDECYY